MYMFMYVHAHVHVHVHVHLHGHVCLMCALLLYFFSFNKKEDRHRCATLPAAPACGARAATPGARPLAHRCLRALPSARTRARGTRARPAHPVLDLRALTHSGTALDPPSGGNLDPLRRPYAIKTGLAPHGLVVILSSTSLMRAYALQHRPTSCAGLQPAHL